MGLTIHWNLKADVRTEAAARELVGRLRQHALDLPLASVGEIMDLSAGTPTTRYSLPSHRRGGC